MGRSTHARRGSPQFLAIGRVVGAFGLQGEVKVEILTDFPERFGLLEVVYLGDPPTPVALEGVRPHKQLVILKLAGYDDRTSAETLRGQEILIPTSEAMPLEEGEYYVHEIEGLDVWTTEGEFLGVVDEVLFTGGNDVYVVRTPEGREVLLPAIEDVIREVDLEHGRMIVTLLDGLV